MKVTLIFPDWVDVEVGVEHDKKGMGIGHYSFAIGMLSALLKRDGHDVRLLHVCYKPTKERFLKRLKEYDGTDIYGFSFSEVEWDWVRDMALWIKEATGKLIVGGGIYPILMPEKVIRESVIDIICVGEGDYAFPELCKRVEAREDFTNLRNLWIKKGSTVIKNQGGGVCENLDELPRYDYDIFDHKRLKIFTSNLPRFYYLCARNCIFSCSFCCNHAKRDAYKSGGMPANKYVRHFSPERVIDDLLFYTKKFPFIKLIHFADDIIHYDREWFSKFTKLYKRNIKIPWRAYVMTKILTQEDVRLMKEAGCARVNVGIEAGSRRVREEIYNRPIISNDEIVFKIKMIREAGIDVHTSTLLGAPTETIDEILQTVKLAARSNSDIAVTGITVPYEGSRLYKMALDTKSMKQKAYENIGVAIHSPEISTGKILFVYNAYRFFVEGYKVIFKMPPLLGRIFERILDFFFKFEYLPHNLLIKLRQNFFQGMLLNWQYRKTETRLGREEHAVKSLND